MKTKILLQFSILSISLFSSLSYAGWPTFTVLKPNEIMDKLVMHDGCPADQGRIPVGTKVKIENRFIPSDQIWNWVYDGDGSCKKIPQKARQLKYLSFKQTDRYSGGVITTGYGTPESQLFAFKFVIPSQPEKWECGPLIGHEPPRKIGCAYDTLKKK